jgi:hypothetical protein
LAKSSYGGLLVGLPHEIEKKNYEYNIGVPMLAIYLFIYFIIYWVGVFRNHLGAI